MERKSEIKKSFVIGVAGASGSGKSTFTDCLKNFLSDYRVEVIHMDDYYKPESELPVMRGISDGKEYTDYNCPEALLLDKIYNDLQNAIDNSCDVIIVEGLFALWDKKIYEQADLKIFIDCDSDEELIRRIKRNLSYGQRIEDITRRYVQVVQPRQRQYVQPTKWKADFIVNGLSPSSIVYEMIVNRIKTNK